MLKHKGSCRCGAIKVGLLTEPFLRFRCHCSNCRAFVSKYDKKAQPYNEGGFTWRWSIVDVSSDDGKLEYDSYTALGGLMSTRRGRCAQCHQPVLEYAGRFGWCFGFVLLPSFASIAPLDTNLFYSSGLHPGTQDLARTLYSDFASLCYETWCVLTVGIFQLPELVWKRMRLDRNDLKATLGKHT